MKESYDVGATISHPEALTGVWEQRLSSGGVLGLSIALTATVDATATTLRGVAQQIRFIRIVTYRRGKKKTIPTTWDSESPGALHWRHNHLRFHDASGYYWSTVSLDLIFDPGKSRWKGTFKNSFFSGVVVLRRPGGVAHNGPVGTWKWAPNGDEQSYCIHVAVGNDGRFVLWRDIVTLNGLSRYVNGLHAPPRTDEMYGELQEDPMEHRVGDRWEFRAGNGLGGENLIGKLTHDGATFSGEETHYGNGENDGRPYPFTWQRVSGDSCAASPA